MECKQLAEDVLKVKSNNTEYGSLLFSECM